MDKEYNIKIDASFFCDKIFVIDAPNGKVARFRVMEIVNKYYRGPMINRFVDMIEDHDDVGVWTYGTGPTFDIVYCEEQEEEDVTFDSVDLELACLIDDPDDNWQAEVEKIRARLWALQKKMGV